MRRGVGLVGEFPGKKPAGAGDDFQVVEVNFAEAEGSCRRFLPVS